MRKIIPISIAVLAVAALAVASSAASGAANKAPLIIAMKDPGCHWFYTGGDPNHRHYIKSITRSGPVTLLNLDEAAMIIKGPGGTKIEQGWHEADAHGEGHLPHHDGQAGSRRQPFDPQGHLKPHAHSRVSMERARLSGPSRSKTMRKAHYPVSFSAGWQAPATGVLALEETRVLLDGRSPQGHVELSIPYAEIGEVRIGRLPEEWLKGHAALLVSQTGGKVIRVQPIGFGLLSELADLLDTCA